MGVDANNGRSDWKTLVNEKKVHYEASHVFIKNVRKLIIQISEAFRRNVCKEYG